MVTNQLIAGDCRMLCGEHCSYEIRCLVSHLWVMAGRRLAVGCQQIVPGVFPNGVVTDRVPFYSGPRKLDKAISVKDIILSPTQGGLPDEQEEAQFYA